MKTCLSLLAALLLSLLLPRSAEANEPDSLPTVPQIYLVTCGPSDSEPFFLYGHTALWVKWPTKEIHHVFNYGLFSFDQPNFLLNFALGAPIYCVGAIPYDDFVQDYKNEGRRVNAQQLNLTADEAEAIVRFLLRNIEPEHRDYLYSFFYDNCATRVWDVIVKHLPQLHTPALPGARTYREAINTLTTHSPWYTFGCNLCLGTQSDRVMSEVERLFLPFDLEQYATHTLREDGSPLVLREQELLPQQREITSSPWWIPGPVLTFALLLFLYLFLYRWPRWHALYRTLLYITIGIGGCILWFLGFGSQHPHTFPNLNMLLFTPLYGILAITHRRKRAQRFNNWLYFANFVGITIGVIGSLLGYQSLLPSIYLIVILLTLDQLSALARYIKEHPTRI